MADKKTNHYGTTSNDTSHRKTWDREAYAARATERDAKARDEAKARHEATLQGKKYVRRASTPPDAKVSEARKSRLDVSSQIGKQTLVAASAAIGKRGRGAGFYCEDCDLTFKDNLQLVEHLNSRQHLIAIGQTGEVTRATVEDVRERLAWLKRKMEEDEKMAVMDLDDRLKARQDQDEQQREENRRKRKEKRQRQKEERQEGGSRMQWSVDDDGVIK